VSGTAGTATRVARVLAAYNRRDLTLACLRSLQTQRLPGVTLDLFVLDEEAVIVAGSTRHPETGELTYGGVVQPYRRRWAGRLWPLYWLSPYVRHGTRLALERAPLGARGVP
jgi:hypothetical protein